MKQAQLAAAGEQENPMRRLYASPGHLIRRCHQIAVGIFLDEFGDTSITPMQCSALIAISEYPGIDQKTLVKLIAADRTTVGSVLRGLEKKQFIVRVTPAEDQRVRRLFILKDGAAFLEKAGERLVKTRARLMAPLNPAEQETFLALLSKIAESNNTYSRAPFDPAAPAEG